MTENFKPHKTNNQTGQIYSPEEWAEKKQAEKDDIYKRVDETALDVVSNPEHFENYLNTQSRLDRYSAVNTLLIYSQKPEASQLKSYADWAQDNVRVKRGEKSISMLEPTEYIKKDGSQGIAYNVKKVFIPQRLTFSMLTAYLTRTDRRTTITISKRFLSRKATRILLLCVRA